MYRYEVIAALIEKYGYSSYLEIGLSLSESFDHIPNTMLKHSVDVAGDPTFKMTSDEFFTSVIGATYDLIFVDGDHSTEQAWRDIQNALRFLNPGGAIVIHDCNPPEEWMAGETDSGGCWMGGVWRSIARLRWCPDLYIYTVDTDCGVAVIREGKQTPMTVPEDLPFEYLDTHRKELLNLISIEDFVNTL